MQLYSHNLYICQSNGWTHTQRINTVSKIIQ